MVDPEQCPTPLHTHSKPYAFLKNMESCCLTQTYTEVKGTLLKVRHMAFHESERSVTVAYHYLNKHRAMLSLKTKMCNHSLKNHHIH